MMMGMPGMGGMPGTPMYISGNFSLYAGLTFHIPEENLFA